MLWLPSILGSLALAAPVVFVPLDSLRPPAERAEPPPRAWLADRLEVELRPGEESRLSLAWTLRPLEPGWVDLPLLGAGAAVAEARVDGEAVALAPGPDGMQHLVLWLDRPRRVALEASLPTPASNLDLPVAPAARRVLRVRGPWEASMEGAVASRGRLDGGDPARIAVSWRPEGPRPPRPTLLRAEAATALRLDVAGVECAARLRWRISHGGVEQVAFRLDPEVEGLEIAGDGVLDHAREGERVVVRLARPVSDRLDLEIRFRAPPRGEQAAALPIPWPEASEVDGWATLLRGDEALIVPSAGAGVEAVAPRALPDWAQGLAEGSPFASYRLGGLDPRLEARLLRWEPVEGPPTVIDEARYELATVDHGRLVLRARYQVRNDRRQFLRLEVPDELELVSVTVAGRAAVPARDAEGRLLVPLEKSVETLSGLVTFPVDIAFFGREEAWSRRGARVITTPAVDAPIAYARWELVLPPGYTARRVKSNATEVPGWTSREISLDYGRSYGEGLAEDSAAATTGELLARVPTGRTYQSAVEVVAGVQTLEEDLPEDTEAEEALNVELGARARADALDLGRLLDRVPSRRPPEPAAPPPPPPRAAPAEEVSQVYWNEAYKAYKENRFEESSALLGEALKADPDNQAAAALQSNLSVLLDTSGDAGSADDELASRRVRELAKAKTGADELRQETLAREVAEAERAGDLAAAEQKLEELVQVSSVLASVEQAEQVEKKEVLREAQRRLVATREQARKGSGSASDKNTSAAPRGQRDAGYGAGGTSMGSMGSGAPGTPDGIESPIVIDAELELLEEIALQPGYATVILEDEEAARQLREALVVEPDLAALLSAEDLLGWTGEEGLRTEVVFESWGAGGLGAYGGGGSGSGGVGYGAGHARVFALPQTVIIPRAGEILRFEARLLPEGKPLSATLDYQQARDRAR